MLISLDGTSKGNRLTIALNASRSAEAADPVPPPSRTRSAAARRAKSQAPCPFAGERVAEARIGVLGAGPFAKCLPPEPVQFGHEGALPGGVRLLERVVQDGEALVDSTLGDQSLGQVRPVGEAEALPDRPEEARPLPHRLEAIARAAGDRASPATEHEPERREERERSAPE